MRQFPSFPSFRFLYKSQNQKLGNLGNFHLLSAKQLQVFKQFPNFPSFRFLFKGQNRKLGNLGNFKFYFRKQNVLISQRSTHCLQTRIFRARLEKNYVILNKNFVLYLSFFSTLRDFQFFKYNIYTFMYIYSIYNTYICICIYIYIYIYIDK